MSDYWRADANREETRVAPLHEQELVAELRRTATDRKLLLFQCAVVRFAPFAQDGQTIWQLVPTFSWFTPRHVTTPPMNVHEAVEVVERIADGRAEPSEIENAVQCLKYTEYFAESDRFGYDTSLLPGSELRYGVAYWIMSIARVEPQAANVLDYYISAYSGNYYAWAHHEPLHPQHRPVALALLNDIFGNPFRPVSFDPAWRTDTAVALARTMYDARDFGAMPILADALQDAGCEDEQILNHCRDANAIHVRGCWVCDLVLGLS